MLITILTLTLASLPVKANETLRVGDIIINSDSKDLTDYWENDNSTDSLTIDTGNIRLNSDSTTVSTPTRNRARVRRSTYSDKVIRQQGIQTTCGNSSVSQKVRITGNNRTTSQSSISTNNRCK